MITAGLHNGTLPATRRVRNAQRGPSAGIGPPRGINERPSPASGRNQGEGKKSGVKNVRKEGQEIGQKNWGQKNKRQSSFFCPSIFSVISKPGWCPNLPNCGAGVSPACGR